MWCCVGTGMENHGKYGQFIYTHESDSLYVNLFVIVIRITAELGNTLVTHNLGHLSICMLVVEVVNTCHHAVEKPMMGETLCCINITAVACHRIGVGIHLVHAAKLVAQHRLHALIVKRSYDSKPPVAEFKEHIPGSLVPGVHPCVTQSGIRLVHIVPWHPCC